MKLTFPEYFKCVNGLTPVTTSAANVGDYISMKNAHKVVIVYTFTQAVSHETSCGVNKATAVAGTSATAVTESLRWWKNGDVSSSDTLTRQTDAASITLTAGATNQMVVCEIDPAKIADTYDCIAATTSASSQATDLVSINYYIDTRYKEDSPPAAITD